MNQCLFVGKVIKKEVVKRDEHGIISQVDVTIQVPRILDKDKYENDEIKIHSYNGLAEAVDTHCKLKTTVLFKCHAKVTEHGIIFEAEMVNFIN